MTNDEDEVLGPDTLMQHVLLAEPAVAISPVIHELGASVCRDHHADCT